MLAALEGVGVGQAQNTLANGQRLEQLPGTEAALRAGALSGPKVTELTGAGVLAPERETDLLDGGGRGPPPGGAGAVPAVPGHLGGRTTRWPGSGASGRPGTSRRGPTPRGPSATRAGTPRTGGPRSSPTSAQVATRLRRAPAAGGRRGPRSPSGRSGPTPSTPWSPGGTPTPASPLRTTPRPRTGPATAGSSPRGPRRSGSPGPRAVPGHRGLVQMAPRMPQGIEVPGRSSRDTAAEPSGTTRPRGRTPPPSSTGPRPARWWSGWTWTPCCGATPRVTSAARSTTSGPSRSRWPGTWPTTRSCAWSSTGPGTSGPSPTWVGPSTGPCGPPSSTGTPPVWCPGAGSSYGLEIDHIVPFAEGGPTTLDNLALLCHHHHFLKTYEGWTLERIDPPAERPPDRNRHTGHSAGPPRWRFEPLPPFGQEPGLGLDMGRDSKSDQAQQRDGVVRNVRDETTCDRRPVAGPTPQ